MATTGDAELDKDLNAAVDALRKEAEKLLDNWVDRPGLGLVLYHFTDCAGLLGILRSRKLWASLATSLNDASETRYALSRFETALTNGVVVPKHLTVELLKEALTPPFRRDIRSYVCSFCSEAQAVHWLHYGRSGTGVAIAFDAISLYSVGKFVLYSAHYDGDDQDGFLRVLTELVDEHARRFASSRKGYDRMFAELAVSYLRIAAPRLKNSVFTSEDEWRLICQETWLSDDESGKPVEPTLETHFRTSNGRVIPYKEVPFEPTAVRGILLGASASMEIDEQGLCVLMETKLGRKVHVWKSDVAVRP